MKKTIAFLLALIGGSVAFAQVTVNGVMAVVGNGTADNTATIQARINLCAAGATCAIELNGSVVVAGTVVLPTTSNINFTGTGAISCTGSGVNCFQRTLPSGFEANRVTFSGLTFVKSNTGAVIADMQTFNSASSQGMTITGNYFTLSGSAVGWLVQGSSANWYSNNTCSAVIFSGDKSGTCIQIQNDTNDPGPQLSTVTGNGFYFVNAVTTVLHGTGDSWEGWNFQGNQYNQGLISIGNGTGISFLNEEFSGTQFTITGNLHDFGIVGSYFDESSNGTPGSCELTVSDASGGNSSLRIVSNHFEQLDGNSQHGVCFKGTGDGSTNVTLSSNIYTAVSPIGITSMSATTNTITVTVPNNYVVGQVVGLVNLSPQVIPNGTVLTVTSATSSQFTASFTSAGFASTSVSGLAYPVVYGIWLDNANDRNFMISGENFRLQWTPIHITKNLSYSTIGAFNQRDTGGPPIDGLSFATNSDSILFAVPNGHFVLGGVTDCGSTLCLAGGMNASSDIVTSGSFVGTGTVTAIDGGGSGGLALQWEQSTQCTLAATFACTVPFGNSLGNIMTPTTVDLYWTATGCTLGTGQPARCTSSTALPSAMPDANYQVFCSADAGSLAGDFLCSPHATPLPTAAAGTINYSVVQVMQNGGSGGTPTVYFHAHHN